ncbi:DUF72 domain-containing protein [Sphingomonas antarctica]|uniref:DUF72 domain-containing protein n=1 Tax=Sphingomonas antarctica TaxID=2040274 RepID=UPI0039E74294
MIRRWLTHGSRNWNGAWSIATKDAPSFSSEGTTLERYSRVFRGVKVNSSFHRRHQMSTWANWAASVPASFRSAVKIPKTITHQAELVDVTTLIAQLVKDVGRSAASLPRCSCSCHLNSPLTPGSQTASSKVYAT